MYYIATLVALTSWFLLTKKFVSLLSEDKVLEPFESFVFVVCSAIMVGMAMFLMAYLILFGSKAFVIITSGMVSLLLVNHMLTRKQLNYTSKQNTVVFFIGIAAIWNLLVIGILLLQNYINTIL